MQTKQLPSANAWLSSCGRDTIWARMGRSQRAGPLKALCRPVVPLVACRPRTDHCAGEGSPRPARAKPGCRWKR